MEHDLNQEGKQANEDCQGLEHSLSGAWCRWDSLAPEESHQPGCDAPDYCLLKIQSLEQVRN
jgi:hypothetical protein